MVPSVPSLAKLSTLALKLDDTKQEVLTDKIKRQIVQTFQYFSQLKQNVDPEDEGSFERLAERFEDIEERVQRECPNMPLTGVESYAGAEMSLKLLLPIRQALAEIEMERRKVRAAQNRKLLVGLLISGIGLGTLGYYFYRKS